MCYVAAWGREVEDVAVVMWQLQAYGDCYVKVWGREVEDMRVVMLQSQAGM